MVSVDTQEIRKVIELGRHDHGSMYGRIIKDVLAYLDRVEEDYDLNMSKEEVVKEFRCVYWDGDGTKGDCHYPDGELRTCEEDVNCPYYVEEYEGCPGTKECMWNKDFVVGTDCNKECKKGE